MTVPLHAHKVTARNDGRHIVPLTIVEQKFKFRIELHPCAFESGGDAVFTAAISHWIAPSALPVGRPVKRALISNIE